MNFLVSTVLTFLLASPALAGGISSPLSISNTQVLPKGVRSLRVGGITTMIDDWHNRQGQIEGIAGPMNQQLSYKRLLSAEQDQDLSANIEAQLRAKGVDLDTIAGQALADVNTRLTVTAPALGIGLSKKWTLAIAFPIVHTNVNVSTSFVGTEGLQNLVTDLAGRSRKKTEGVKDKLNDVIATELAGKDYAPLVNREMTELGDVALIGKYRAFSGRTFRLSLTQRVNIATGRDRDANRLVDPAPGDGQNDIGLTVNSEYLINGRLSLLGEVGYLAQLPDFQDARLPISAKEFLSADYDARAYRDMGDIVHGNVAVQYKPFNFLTLATGYQISHKNQDYWSGDLFDQSRYGIIGQFTGQNAQSVVFQATASTVNAYRAKKFPVPLSAGLVYSKVFAGKFVRNAGIWSGQLSMFF